MKTCLFCRNTLIYNIHNDFGNNHTSKDDMIQFFGYQIESHLRPDDAICNHCMNIMDSVAKLKRRLLPLIFRSETTEEDCKPVNFGKKWTIFASTVDEDSFLESRSPTPSSLVTCKRVVPYESPVEIRYAETERHRSLSRVSEAKSDADSEILDAFSNRRGRRRRRRGHNLTRRKNGRYSRASSTRSSTSRSRINHSVATTTRSYYIESRPVSVMSTDSYESFYPPGLESTSPLLVTPVTEIRTKSLTKKQEDEIRLYFKDDELHQCCLDNCSFICEDIDLMARHKIDKHQQLALFWCNFCGKKYTSNGDLEIHKRTHAERYSCVICHKEFYFDSDFLEHWQEHVKKSVPCKYCGKRFVDRKVCNRHQKNEHRRNIPSRIDYDKTVETANAENKDFEVRILVQDGEQNNED